MAPSNNATRDLVKGTVLPALLAERDRLNRIDRWARWDHDKPHAPAHATTEYRGLARAAQTPWLALVVTAVAQALYVEGYRRARAPEDAAPWSMWQRNGLDSRQIAVHRAALRYGQANVKVLPGEDLSGTMPVIRGVSPRRMITMWADAAADDWPMFALQADPAKVGDGRGWDLRLYDDEDVHHLQADAGGSNVTYLDSRRHGVGVCPVVRFTSDLDLEGRAGGEVDPFISVASRIDQTTFDRLVVQRFASWVVRTVAGMAKPEQEDEAAAKRLLLKVEHLLVAEDADTKFGSLPATPLDGFIAARDADIRDLAAVTQTPPHHLLGQMANLSAEALAAAEASLSRKIEERKHTFGESWEQTLRLAGHVAGNRDAAADFEAQVRWRDMESRSLAQAADALGKLAQMLSVPVELLWEKIPGWTQQDVERAKELAAQGGGMADLLRQLADGQVPTPPDQGDPGVGGEDPAEVKAKADALGSLIRAGVDAESAAARVGLSGLEFTGAVPVSLRLPAEEASSLEAS